MAKRYETFTADELRARLRTYDRTPFLDLLAIMLENAPTEGDLRMLARKSPDKFISALSQLARTSGFTDRTEQTGTITHVHKLSDSQLEDRIAQLSHQMALPSPTIDAEFEAVENVARSGIDDADNA